MTTIGFIGFGKMAEALWMGARSVVSETGNAVYEINESRQNVAINSGLLPRTITDLFAGVSVLFLCVKPQNFQSLPVLPAGPNAPLVASILAGISISDLQEKLPGHAIARVMPNTPAMVGEGMSAVSFSEEVSATDIEALKYILSTCGKVEIVPESLMDMVTGISGSGPAFLYQLCKAAVAAAGRDGMSEQTAIQLFSQTLIGAGKMLQRSGKTPEQLTVDVTSPGGTTFAGLQEYNRLDIGKHFESVIIEAAKRSKELSQLS